LPQTYKSKLENLGYRVVIERPDLSETELIEALSGVDAYILGGTDKPHGKSLSQPQTSK
jgi:hypothetical protein